ATGTGIKLNQTGLWTISLLATWKATTQTQTNEAVRMIRLEVNGSDIGVRDVVEEQATNKSALHNHLTWTDTFSKDTTISMGVRTDMNGAAGAQAVLHAYIRAYLVRCHDSAGAGGSVPFDPIPDQQPGDTPPTNT